MSQCLKRRLLAKPLNQLHYPQLTKGERELSVWARIKTWGVSGSQSYILTTPWAYCFQHAVALNDFLWGTGAVRLSCCTPSHRATSLSSHLGIKRCKFGFQGVNSACGGLSSQPEPQQFQKHSNQPISPKECLNFYAYAVSTSLRRK